ncbi:J domain-containing protein [Paraburkholderia sp. EG287B]|uniref:J domain-containing protein n=1 Tax=unclassified Paraburkholderia TaxID=2615204 RepID=UPI0034D186BC
MHTHYDNLKVARNAPLAVIKAAYRALSQQYHPDKNNSPDAKRIMQILNDAWAVLGDEEARTKYDRKLAAEEAMAAEEREEALRKRQAEESARQRQETETLNPQAEKAARRSQSAAKQAADVAYDLSYVRFTRAAERFESAYRKYTWNTDLITGFKTALAIMGAYLAEYAHPIDAKLAKRIVKSELPCVIELEAAVKELKRHGPLSDVLARVCGRQTDGRSGYSGRVVKLSRRGDRHLYGLTPVVQLAFRIAGLGEIY